MSMMRFCPNCQTERALLEISCLGLINNQCCGWDLSYEPIRESGWRAASIQTLDKADNSLSETLIDGWLLIKQISESKHVYQRYYVEHQDDNRTATLTLYNIDRDPNLIIYSLIDALPKLHTPDIIQVGRWQEHGYVVTKRLPPDSLADLGIIIHDEASVKSVVNQLGQALHCFAEAGLRLCDLRPETLLVKNREPLEFIISDFGSARLAESDLEIISPLKFSHYTAPETITGGVSISSDWWSLGIILLEQLTNGQCFNNNNSDAFLIDIMTNDIVIPDNINSTLRTLLRGLLTKNHHQRWQWQQVKAWLNDEVVSEPNITNCVPADNDNTNIIELNASYYHDIRQFAFAMTQMVNEKKALELCLNGSLFTWLKQKNYSAKYLNLLYDIIQHEVLPDSLKLMLVRKVLNPLMPLIFDGKIVSTTWLIEHPIIGFEIINSDIPKYLYQLDSENWLWQLHERIASVHKRAKNLNIELDKELSDIYLLSTLRSQLLARWQVRWQQYPDTHDIGLLSLIEAQIIDDEALIILLSCSLLLFRSVDDVLRDVKQYAQTLNVAIFSDELLMDLIQKPRTELYQLLNETIHGLAKTNNNEINQIVEQYRLKKRLSLTELLLLLSIDENYWLQPEKQQYITQLVDFFSKKVTTAIMQGPLVRMKLSAVTARVDLYDLGSQQKPAYAIIDHLLARSSTEYHIDSTVFVDNEQLTHRLTSLQNQRLLDFRDSGVNCLYMGFPFLFYRETHVNRLPRIAPVFLWPVNIDSEIGTEQQIALKFDRQREEVRINPALESILGKTLFTQLINKRDELIASPFLSQQHVMDSLGDIGQINHRELVPLSDDIKLKRGNIVFDCSAVLFNINFVGQVIGEDLRQLKQLAPTGTALETALGLHDSAVSTEIVKKPLESERFLTAASDPSQENAILKARQAPGLLIEGPPGTGKSQTIVNMVADAIGLGKTLLIICQKKAALDVVYKRLAAEQLSCRSMMINSINTDRLATITSVREQVADILNIAENPIDDLVEQRLNQADYITNLEQSLDDAYQLMHREDSSIGLNYRQIISELINLTNKEEPFPPLDNLRLYLQHINKSQLELLEHECAPLVQYWLPANYEDNPLMHLLSFSNDEIAVNQFKQSFDAFINAEKIRTETLSLNHGDFDDPTTHQQWFQDHSGELLSIDEPLRQRLNQWLTLFKTEHGNQIILQLEGILAKQKSINHHIWQNLSADLVALSDEMIEHLIQYCQVANSPSSLLSVFDFKRQIYHRRVKRYLANLNYSTNAQTIIKLSDALQLELLYRPIRQSLNQVYQQLNIDALPATLGPLIADDIRERIKQLVEVRTWLNKLSGAATRYDDVENAVLSSHSAVRQLLQTFDNGLLRYNARCKSLDLLTCLKGYLAIETYHQMLDAITHNQTSPIIVAAIHSHLSEIMAYQDFRLKAAKLSVEALAIFASLRPYQDIFINIPERDLDGKFRLLLNIEARFGWKSKLECEYPALLASSKEHEEKIVELVAADNHMRQLNRQFLAKNIHRNALASLTEWEAISRLTGQRALRLREFITQGIALGLMAVRPVWLMTPDIASQILPLEAGLFDVVIYDEASQMPVEYALPTLYRAKTMIVSGDEKQMPPTSFFSSQIQLEDEEVTDLKSSLEDNRDKHLQLQQNCWNQHEITDCPDLLQLARRILPSTTLQIHYRSNYRELINFSNTAFYQNRLHVPVRHTQLMLERIKPIELIQVNGIYREQTNIVEAQCVLEQIAQLWQIDAERRPTIGVVTFNKKQADLIWSVVNQRIADDERFKQIYIEESNRQDNGEDMSFFIKNVENVQGDERDIIIFSTTFGRNELGIFRRNFGILGQQGGERRLNVAITRAKNRVIIVCSMPINDISDMLVTQRLPKSPRDYLQSYLEYARTLTQSQWQQNEAILERLQPLKPYRYTPINYARDGFLNDVAQFLDSLNIDYDYVSGNDVFSLDFAIKDSNTNQYLLGIECDPPYNSLLANARAREIWRINVLKKSLPHVYRISSAAWFADKKQIQNILRQLIDQIRSDYDVI